VYSIFLLFLNLIGCPGCVQPGRNYKNAAIAVRRVPPATDVENEQVRFPAQGSMGKFCVSEVPLHRVLWGSFV
jgi:hypothetical protein